MSVGRIGWRWTCAVTGARHLRDRVARVVRLLLVDICRLRRDGVDVSDVLVLGIDGGVGVAVGRRGRVQVVRIALPTMP